MNRKILFSMMSIMTALILVGGATFAYFSDTVTSNGNTFSTGTLSFEIRDDNEGFSEAVTQSTFAENMVPGGQVDESYVCFQNNGAYDIQQILVSLNATGNVIALAPWINLTKIEMAPVAPGDCANFEGGSFDEDDDYTDLFVTRFDEAPHGDNNGVVSLKEQLDQIDGTDQVNDDLLNRIEALLPADPNVLLKLRTTWQLSADTPDSAQAKSVVLNTTYKATQEEVDEDGPQPIPTP